MELRQEGQVLGGKYRLIRQLGQGGMGSVWLAHHLVLNASVALKFIDAQRLDVESLQRFLGEARMAAALRSPHVVQILDYGVVDDTPHIAMELLEGESLAERLARVGRLEPSDAARVVQQVARALGRAHDAGIVHRDLKPENVFIVANDDDEVVKVLDFGIAKANRATLGSSAAVATTTGALLGTLYYMSPEQVDGGKSLDHRSDIWSLGVLCFKLLLGHLPFEGDSVGRVVLAICSRPLPVPSSVGRVPPGFDAWFARACAREPGDRFASVREAARELLTLCGVTGTKLLEAPASEAPVASEGLAPDAVAPLATTTQRATYAEPGSSRRPPRFRRRFVALAVSAPLAVLVVLSVVRLRTFETRPVPVAPALPSTPPPAPPRAGKPPQVAPVPASDPPDLAGPTAASLESERLAISAGEGAAANGSAAPAPELPSSPPSLAAGAPANAAAHPDAAELAPERARRAEPVRAGVAVRAGTVPVASSVKLDAQPLTPAPSSVASVPVVEPPPSGSAGVRPEPPRAASKPAAKPTIERIPAVPTSDVDLGI